MEFVDLHTHIIAGVDDGAADPEEMYALIDAEYRSGVRWLCCTPHFHPGYYGNQTEKIDAVFQQAGEYAKKMYPDLELFLGNELHYYDSGLEAVRNGACRTLNGTRYLLMDFSHRESRRVIEQAVIAVLRQGYIPVLAHVERYDCFVGKSRLIASLRRLGAVIQVNADSICGRYHYWTIRRLLREQIVDIVASDAHNLSDRPPVLREAYAIVEKRCGEKYAEELFFTNPYEILKDK